MKWLKEILPRVLGLFLVIFLVFGGVYTLAVTGVGNLFFADKAKGSLIEVDGKVYGSTLLAQEYTSETHLWGRMMVLDTHTFTDKQGKAVAYALPQNRPVATEEYAKLVEKRTLEIQAAHPEQKDRPVPVDLVTMSGSGLDPHISVAAAEYQIPRLARTTGKTPEEIRAVIEKYTEGRFLGVFGEPRVNVLQVNLALDGILG